MRPLLLAGVHRGAVAVLVLLTLSACLLVSGLPRLTQGAFDEALRESLRAAPAQQADLTAVLASRGGQDDLRERAQFGTLDERLRTLVPAPLQGLLMPPGAGHTSAKTYDTPVHETGGLTFINLGWLSDSDRRVDWVAGRAPGPPRQTRWRGMDLPLFEVGVVDETQDAMGLKIGDLRILGESDHAAIEVVGVFRAKDAADRYWSHNEDILHVSQVQQPGRLEPEKHITALIPDAALTVLSGADRNLSYQWVLPIDHRAAGALSVPELSAAIGEFERLMRLQPGNLSGYRLVTGLPGLLSAFLTALATARTVLFLVLGGLLVVALGVIVLAAQLLVDRLDHALTLARARGGSLPRVAGTGAALVALAAGPAALAGYALSYLFPGPVLPIVHLGPLIVAGTVVAFAAARIAVTHRTPLHERRDDVVAARPSARRITLEVLVVGLALGGAYLLRTRGLTGAGQGPDPFLLLVPLGLTLAAALITMRCYPYPLRLFVRLAARLRPVVPFLGLTRAARARSFSVLPVLILLPALGVSVFASVISGGVSSTQRLAAWQSVGAPIKITSRVELPAEVIERVRQVPGVRRVVPAQTASVQVGYSPERAGIVAVDLARWRELLADAPIDLPAPPAAASGIPALVSTELRGRGTFEIGWHARLSLSTQGVIGTLPGFHAQGKFIVVPFDTGQRPAADTLLIDGDADLAALSRAAPGATVESQARALAAIQDDPLTGTVRATLLVVTLALAGYALVAVVITLMIGAADRARALSFLRTLGLSDRQARRLTVLEILPMICVTALAGLALGLALPAALGPGVDLSAYAGGLPVGAYELDLLTPVALAAGLAAVAVLGAYAHGVVSRRRSLGAILRVGDLS